MAFDPREGTDERRLSARERRWRVSGEALIDAADETLEIARSAGADEIVPLLQWAARRARSGPLVPGLRTPTFDAAVERADGEVARAIERLLSTWDREIERQQARDGRLEEDRGAAPAALTHVPVEPLPVDRFDEILVPEQLTEFRTTVERGRRLMEGRTVWNVNSTSRGGGVAEMLASLVGYCLGAGVDARWVVMQGSPAFFTVIKRIHNMLHSSPGDGGGLGPVEEAVYRDMTQANARELARLVRPNDIVLLHDPQTAGMVDLLRQTGARVVWRCHVGVDVPTEVARAVWRFLSPFCQYAETFIFSRDAYVWDGLDRSRLMVVPPSIDAFSPKNQPLHADTVSAILRIAGLESGEPPTAPEFIRSDGATGSVDRRADLSGGRPAPPDVPLLVQISRWDRLKDHIGVMKAFAEAVAPQTDAHLMLAGPSAASVIDDPEGLEVLNELEGFWRSLQEPMRSRVHLASLPMDDAEENAAIVNALQRRATVVAQKSLAEGFGLTVSEAMWKSRPVIGGRTGGIQDQIQDGDTGVLVEPSDLRTFAREATRLIGEPDLAARIGGAAHEEVRRSFLGPRHLRQYVDLFQALLGVSET